MREKPPVLAAKAKHLLNSWNNNWKKIFVPDLRAAQASFGAQPAALAGTSRALLLRWAGSTTLPGNPSWSQAFLFLWHPSRGITWVPDPLQMVNALVLCLVLRSVVLEEQGIWGSLHSHWAVGGGIRVTAGPAQCAPAFPASHALGVLITDDVGDGAEPKCTSGERSSHKVHSAVPMDRRAPALSAHCWQDNSREKNNPRAVNTGKAFHTMEKYRCICLRVSELSTGAVPTPPFPASVAFLEMDAVSSAQDSAGAPGCTAAPSPAWMPLSSWNCSIQRRALHRALAELVTEKPRKSSYRVRVWRHSLLSVYI